MGKGQELFLVQLSHFCDCLAYLAFVFVVLSPSLRLLSLSLPVGVQNHVFVCSLYATSLLAPHALQRAAAAVGAGEYESDGGAVVNLKHHARDATADSCV